ncbi:MAG: PP2C family protein-serine/threonine phosphatase [Planctomycetota bacterium]
MSDPEIQRWGNGSTAVVSRASPRSGAVNEDAAAVAPCGPEAVALVVADGMGGERAGARAARLAVGSLVEALDPPPPDANMRRLAIMKGFELANERVLAMGVGAGTTLAVLEIDGRVARPYHAGDSLILIVGQRGKVRYQNVAHSPVGYALESGLIDEHEAIHHDERNVISNMVGSPDMSVEVGPPVALSPRDTAVVASDGVSDNLWVREIVESIRVGPLSRVCSTVDSLVQARMTDPDGGAPSKPDDMTFALFRPAPASSG